MTGLQNVTFAYGDTPVLDNFTLTLPARSAVCLFGASGCGKTTVLHLLAGLLAPQVGAVHTRAVSMVFQEDRLLPWLTALENVQVILPAAQRDTAAQWLEAVDLADAKDMYPAAMSGGMRRRVAIARALAKGGDMLLLDEPFNGLDAEVRAVCAKALRARFDNGIIVLVSHSKEDAALLQAEIVSL